MSDLTTRLSKAVWEYLDTATLRKEPFSLSRIEEVVAGVMATERKSVLDVVHVWDQMEANRKRQADFREIYKAQLDPAERAALEQYWVAIQGLQKSKSGGA